MCSHALKRSACAVGSVKSNIGHPEQAAGLAGLVKAALALKHQLIPATLHQDNPNPNIPFAGSPFFVADRNLAWPETATPRRAAVNSLGIGGTNAFVLLEEAPRVASETEAKAEAEAQSQLFCLSARNAHDLAARAGQVQALLENGDGPALDELCLASNRGRTSLPQRLAVVVSSGEELAQAMAAAAQDPASSRSAAEPLPVTFLYSGQGAQHAGMGKELYPRFPAFRAAFDECEALFSERLGTRLKDVMFGDQVANADIDDTLFAQPALFTFEFAMTRLWASG